MPDASAFRGVEEGHAADEALYEAELDVVVVCEDVAPAYLPFSDYLDQALRCFGEHCDHLCHSFGVSIVGIVVYQWWRMESYQMLKGR